VTEAGCATDRTAEKIRVLLVDDHRLLRQTLAEVLSAEDDLIVVGECDDGAQVVRAVARLRPDVVFMDVRMSGVDGLSATEALHAAQSEARVIVLTAEGSGIGPRAVAAGAHAVVPKEVRLGALLRCLRAVAQGDGGGCPYCL
jgi:DNA-binding NarL/FixJ family response regulator